MCLSGSSSATVQPASRPIVIGRSSNSRVWKGVRRPPCLVKILTVSGMLGRGAHVAPAPPVLDPPAVHHRAILFRERQRLAQQRAASEELGFLGEPRGARRGEARGERAE